MCVSVCVHSLQTFLKNLMKLIHHRRFLIIFQLFCACVSDTYRHPTPAPSSSSSSSMWHSKPQLALGAEMLATMLLVDSGVKTKLNCKNQMQILNFVFLCADNYVCVCMCLCRCQLTPVQYPLRCHRWIDWKPTLLRKACGQMDSTIRTVSMKSIGNRVEMASFPFYLPCPFRPYASVMQCCDKCCMFCLAGCCRFSFFHSAQLLLTT